jgi:hypothetical protein
MCEHWEYGGVIYQIPNSDDLYDYSYTPPKKGLIPYMAEGTNDPPPTGATRTGSYHTHPGIPGSAAYADSAGDDLDVFMHGVGYVLLPNGDIQRQTPGPASPNGTYHDGTKSVIATLRGLHGTKCGCNK